VNEGCGRKRTIVYAAWDGEEQGLLGSTEWVEHHEAELRDKAAVYINTDGNGRGFLGVGGSPARAPLGDAVARAVVKGRRKRGRGPGEEEQRVEAHAGEVDCVRAAAGSQRGAVAT